MIPTYVVILVKAGEREEMTARLVEQLGDYPIRLDDSERTITQKWNDGLYWAWMETSQARDCPHNVAILNNDIEVCNGFLDKLAAGLRSDDGNWIASPDYCGLGIPPGMTAETESDCLAQQTICGWAFMLRGEVGVRFDEQFKWWYGDSDMEKQVRAAGKRVVWVGGCNAKHLDPLRSSMNPTMLAIARADEARFAAKWGIDPKTLWLAKNPDFGKMQ